MIPCQSRFCVKTRGADQAHDITIDITVLIDKNKATPISDLLKYSEHPEYVGCFILIAGLDAFQAILFSRLRQQHRPIKFMVLKMAFIIPNVLLNVFVFWLMPKMFSFIPGQRSFLEDVKRTAA